MKYDHKEIVFLFGKRCRDRAYIRELAIQQGLEDEIQPRRNNIGNE